MKSPPPISNSNLHRHHGLPKYPIFTGTTAPPPVLPFLVFLEFLGFWPCKEFLVFLSVFPFFSRDFRGSVGIKNPCFLVVFLATFQKNKERKDRAMHPIFTGTVRPIFTGTTGPPNIQFSPVPRVCVRESSTSIISYRACGLLVMV